MFDSEGKIVAVRTTEKASLVAKDNSVWQRSLISRYKPMSKELRAYHEQEALEYYNWIKREKCTVIKNMEKRKTASVVDQTKHFLFASFLANSFTPKGSSTVNR
ncbi:hypothetical protein GQR36_27275 [Enterococcus termitis]